MPASNGTLVPPCRLVLPLLLAAALPAFAQAPPQIGFRPADLAEGPFEFDTAEQDGIRVEVVATGFGRAFSLAFLPNGDALISERGVGLRLVSNATGARGGPGPALVEAPVAGGPPRGTGRGGGMHEVAVHPDFASNNLIYYTYNAAAEASSGGQPTYMLTLARARYADGALSNTEVLMQGEAVAGASGSRLAFAPDGFLYMTTGAPFGNEAQDPANIYGKVLRMTGDGGVPPDNPFAGRAGARGEVFTLGHRDQLGLTVHAPSGAVLSVEHGPNGGDEVNRALPGRNYGWPVYSFGRSYEGPRQSSVPLGPDTEQPLILWLPSIGPSGLAFYFGDAFPEWNGNLFVGSARRGEIPGTGSLERVVLNENLEELRRESLLGDLHARIRDVRQGPDDLLYVLTDDTPPALLRISPLTR
jgi:glucose/arabinose dehydrogenase